MNKFRDNVRSLKSEFPDERIAVSGGITVFHPGDPGEASRFFTLANRLGQPLFISGTGANLNPGAENLTDMIVVKTDRLNQLVKVVEQDLYVTVGAGYPLKDLNRALEGYGLFVPHADLPYPGTTGGAAAVNIAAELNGHDLPFKKYLIKAEIVTPEGEIISPGSVCFKSVAGYDIVKIFASSWGLLGLLVNLYLRVIPASAREEYAGMKMKPVSRENFLNGLKVSERGSDAVYARKIKDKFDPNGILPVLS
ncbi:MAG: FAD-binding oxidoreductase [Candidatus Zixiibacteriota bacterium]